MDRVAVWRARRWLAALATAVLGASCAVGATLALRSSETRAIEEKVRRTAEARAEAVRHELAEAVGAVEAVRALHAASATVSRREFDAFAAELAHSAAGLQAIEWVPRVPAGSRATYERLARAEGVEGFRFRERSPAGELVPARYRPFHYPVYFAAPLDAGAALGFDFASSPDLLAPLLRARDSGRPAASGPLTLLASGERGYLVFVPIFAKDVPIDTVERRRDALHGFAVAVLSPEELLAATLAPGEDFEAMLSDPAVAGGGLLAFQGAAAGPLVDSVAAGEARLLRAGGTFHRDFPLELAGRQWRLALAPAPGYVAGERTWVPWAALGLGLAFTALIVAGALLASARRVRTERLVAERTKELREANASLRDTTGRLEALIEASPLAILSLDTDGRVTSWSPAAEALLGWSAAELIGRPFPAVPPDRVAEFEAHRRSVIEEGRTVRLETRRLRKDGTLVDVAVHLAPLRDQRGTVVGHMTVVADITDRKRGEAALRESEERFRTMADSAPVLIWMSDAAGAPAFFNRGWLEFTGQSLAAELRQPFAGVHPEDLDRAKAAFAAGLAAREGYEAEYRLLRFDGEYRWVFDRAAARFLPDGSFAGLTGIVVDITKRRLAEQALRESEERFRTIADSAPGLIWMADRDGGLTFVNRGWRDFTGLPADAQLGDGWLEAVHPEDRERTVVAYYLHVARREPYELEFRMRRFDGEYRWLVDRGVPRYVGGEFAGYVGASMDITEHKLGEQEHERLLRYEREQVERLRELDRMKDDLVATVSHELRTPLTNILGYLHLVRGEPSPASAHRILDVVDRNAQRLLHLVDDLLVVAQLRSGKLAVELEPVDLAAVAREAVENARPAAEKKGLRLELAAEPVPTLAADPVRLGQLFDNLLSNAVKFTPEGGRVALRVGVAGSAAVVEVEDSGIGISEAEQPQLFEQFYRTPEARSQAVQGTGLGLTIVKAIAEAHNGSVSVRSAVGRGATFRVELPLENRGLAAA